MQQISSDISKTANGTKMTIFILLLVTNKKKNWEAESLN